MPQFTDQSGPSSGTALGAATLDALVLASSYWVAGTAPTPSGTLAQAIPAQQVVLATSGSATYYSIALQNITVSASSDSYVDVQPGGTYLVSAVANGAAAPALTTGNLRLFKIVSGASSVSACSNIAINEPITPQMILADLVEAATNDSLSGGNNNLLSTLNRLRFQLAQIYGGAWNSGTAMIPLSQKGAASGVAQLNGASAVLGAGAFFTMGATGNVRLWDGNGAHPSIWLNAGQGFASFSNNAYWDGGAWRYELNGPATLLQFNGATIALYHAASGTANAVITWTESAVFTNTATTLFLPTTINALLTASGIVATGNLQVNGNATVGGTLGVTGLITQTPRLLATWQPTADTWTNTGGTTSAPVAGPVPDQTITTRGGDLMVALTGVIGATFGSGSQSLSFGWQVDGGAVQWAGSAVDTGGSDTSFVCKRRISGISAGSHTLHNVIAPSTSTQQWQCLAGRFPYGEWMFMEVYEIN